MLELLLVVPMVTFNISALLIVLIVLVLVFGMPVFPYARGWGYGPAGMVAAILVVLLLLVLFNVL